MAVKKTTTTKPVAVEPELPSGNRYQRAARVILRDFAIDDIDIDLLAKRAELSLSASRYCVEAFLGIRAAMIEAKLLAEAKAVEPTTKVEPRGK